MYTCVEHNSIKEPSASDLAEPAKRRQPKLWISRPPHPPFADLWLISGEENRIFDTEVKGNLQKQTIYIRATFYIQSFERNVRISLKASFVSVYEPYSNSFPVCKSVLVFYGSHGHLFFQVSVASPMGKIDPIIMDLSRNSTVEHSTVNQL